MKKTFTASVWQEGEHHVAQCLEIDVASQGASRKEALDNLREALELNFEKPRADPIPGVEKIEVDVGAA